MWEPYCIWNPNPRNWIQRSRNKDSENMSKMKIETKDLNQIQKSKKNPTT